MTDNLNLDDSAGKDIVPQHDRRFIVPPWHLSQGEVEKEIKIYLVANPQLPQNLPVSQLTAAISFGHIFQGPLYDNSFHPRLVAKQDELLDSIDATWHSLPKELYQALWKRRRGNTLIIGGYQQFVVKNREAIKKQYSEVNQSLQNRFGDHLYLWRGLARNLNAKRFFNSQSIQPVTSYSAEWKTAVKFGLPMGLYEIPLEQIIAVIHSNDDPSNSYQAEFIVDTSVKESQPFFTITPPLLPLLDHIDLTDFVHKISYLKER